MKNCAFEPHVSLFHFHGGKVEDAELRLDHCSAMLNNLSSVFLLSDNAVARLFVNHCLFSNPAPVPADGAAGTVLVRQTGAGLGRFRFDSASRNVYHHFGAFWVQGAKVQSPDLEEFRLALGIGRNDRSVALTVNPWQLDKPIAALAQPEKAFQASQDIEAVRGTENPDTRMVGVESCFGVNLYPATLRALKEKIVDLTVKESGHGIYPSLGQAIGEAKPGDTILIKANEAIAVTPLRLEDRLELLDLTIKPYQGCRPVLKIGPTSDPDSAMFRYGDGKLTFENLEFEMPAPPAGLKAQSLIFLTGEGQCTFKKCLFTMREKETKTDRSLFTLPDPSTVMRKDAKSPPQAGPRLRLEGCFMRGEGDVVTVRGSQAFTLEIEDSLATLEGSIVIVDPSTKEPPTRPPVQISFTRFTAYLSEPLLLLRGGEKMSGLVPTHVIQVNQCVFATTREKNALVHLDGMDSDEQMKRLFSWGEGKQNIYSGFMTMLEQRPRPDNAMPLSQFSRDKWEEFTPREEKRRYDKVTFTGWPVVDRPLSRAFPTQFRIKAPADLPAGSGADVDRLPRPTGEMEPEPATATSPEEN
jgi:hypothetical protein